MHAKVADMLKKNKVSTEEKMLINNAYHCLIEDYIKKEAMYEELEAKYRVLENKYKELQEIIRESKILN